MLSLITHQKKYLKIQAVKFTKGQQNHGGKIRIWKCIKHIIKKIYRYMTSISKYVYIDKLIDIANKYKNTYESTIKVNFVDVKSTRCIDSDKKILIKILNLMFVTI